jgi:transcriptional regulator with XRE-family HTH domain
MATSKTATAQMAAAPMATKQTAATATFVAPVPASPGTMIAAARRRCGLSQRVLAGRLCMATGTATVSRHEISRWERGTRLPSAYWLDPLAALLGIDRAEVNRAVVRARRDRRRSRADVADVLSRWRVTRVPCAASPQHLAERPEVIVGVIDVAAPPDNKAPRPAIRRARRSDGVFAVVAGGLSRQNARRVGEHSAVLVEREWSARIDEPQDVGEQAPRRGTRPHSANIGRIPCSAPGPIHGPPRPRRR